MGAAVSYETHHVLTFLLVMDRFPPMVNLQKHVYVSVLKKESPKLVDDNSGATTSLQNIVSVYWEAYVIEIFCRLLYHTAYLAFSHINSLDCPGYAIEKSLQPSLLI